MIYLIKTKGNDFYKIGYTSDSVNKRLKSIQTCCPYKLKVINKINGAMEQEKILHTLFKEYRTQGEWFKLDKKHLNILVNVMEFVDKDIDPPKNITKKKTKNKTRKEYNKKQKEWYRWRVRANKVGVPLLKNCRPTQKIKEDWINTIIKAEEL